MQSSDSLHEFDYTVWDFKIIVLHFLYKLWILHILATSINEETCIAEMRTWCRKIDTVNVITELKRVVSTCTCIYRLLIHCA